MQKSSEFLESLREKPIELWMTIIGLAIYVGMRDAETESISRRIGKTLASGFLALGVSPSIAEWAGFSEIIASVMVMTCGLLALDVLTGIVADREFMKQIVKRRLGGGQQDGND